MQQFTLPQLTTITAKARPCQLLTRGPSLRFRIATVGVQVIVNSTGHHHHHSLAGGGKQQAAANFLYDFRGSINCLMVTTAAIGTTKKCFTGIAAIYLYC